jgi:hypothetical protein
VRRLGGAREEWGGGAGVRGAVHLPNVSSFRESTKSSFDCWKAISGYLYRSSITTLETCRFFDAVAFTLQSTAAVACRGGRRRRSKASASGWMMFHGRGLEGSYTHGTESIKAFFSY